MNCFDCMDDRCLKFILEYACGGGAYFLTTLVSRRFRRLTREIAFRKIGIWNKLRLASGDAFGGTLEGEIAIDGCDPFGLWMEPSIENENSGCEPRKILRTPIKLSNRTRAIIRAGPSALSVALDLGYQPSLDATYICAEYNAAECLKILHERMVPFDNGIVPRAMDCGSIDCLRYIFEHNCPSRSTHLGIPLSEKVPLTAITSEILHYYTATTQGEAVSLTYGGFEIELFSDPWEKIVLSFQGIFFGIGTHSVTDTNPDRVIECVEYLCSFVPIDICAGNPLTRSLYSSIGSRGDLKILQYIRQKGCAFGHSNLMAAICRGSGECVEYILENSDIRFDQLDISINLRTIETSPTIRKVILEGDETARVTFSNGYSVKVDSLNSYRRAVALGIDPSKCVYGGPTPIRDLELYKIACGFSRDSDVGLHLRQVAINSPAMGSAECMRYSLSMCPSPLNMDAAMIDCLAFGNSECIQALIERGGNVNLLEIISRANTYICAHQHPSSSGHSASELPIRNSHSMARRTVSIERMKCLRCCALAPGVSPASKEAYINSIRLIRDRVLNEWLAVAFM